MLKIDNTGLHSQPSCQDKMLVVIHFRNPHIRFSMWHLFKTRLHYMFVMQISHWEVDGTVVELQARRLPSMITVQVWVFNIRDCEILTISSLVCAE